MVTACRKLLEPSESEGFDSDGLDSDGLDSDGPASDGPDGLDSDLLALI